MTLKLRSAILFSGMILVVLFSSAYQVYAEGDISFREKRRRIIPLDKLKIFLDAPKRVQTMQPGRVIEILGINRGEYIADIGAGTGFFSFYLSEKVGKNGLVYAVEIEEELLEVIREKMTARKVTNIIPVKSAESSPDLPSACCDKILIANTYIYFDDPVAYMKKVLQALKTDGKIAIIEVDAEKVKSRKLLLQIRGRMQSEVIKEMKDAGFMLEESHDFLESRFFLVFSPVKK